MAIVYALPTTTAGLRIQRATGNDAAFFTFPRLPFAGGTTVDGEILDEPYDGTLIYNGVGTLFQNALDLYDQDSIPVGAALRQSTVSYGGGSFFLRYTYYNDGSSGNFVRQVVAISVLDADFATLLDITANTFGSPVLSIDFTLGLVIAEGGRLVGTLGSVDIADAIGSALFNTFTGTGQNDVIVGTEFNDAIFGLDGNDTLSGASGDDYLVGGLGRDVIDGGAGMDIADFSDKTGAVVASLRGALAASVTVGGTAEDTLRNVEGLIGGSGNDVFTGDTSDNELLGGGGNDTLVGADGDDFLEGGIGNDRLEGGVGIDTASFSGEFGPSTPAGTTLSVALAGNSVAEVLVDNVVRDQLLGIENLIGSDFADLLVGDGLANVLAGGLGNDTLRGGEGDDVLAGGAGVDVLDGGAGTDTASWASVLDGRVGAPVGAYRVTLNGATAATLFRNGTAAGTLTNIEQLQGGAGNDTFTGDAQANRLQGDEGDDTLNGGGGNDVLIGGAGVDALDGGLGSDTVDYSGRTLDGGLVITLAGSTVTTAVVGFSETDTLRNIENVIGSEWEDNLIGGAGNNTLSGMGGADVLQGGTGRDLLLGGSGLDTSDYSDKALAIAVTLKGAAAAQVLVNGVLEDTLRDIEWVIGGNGADNLVGDAFINSLSGGSGNDTLSGGGGADVLTGGAGRDVLDGGTGFDTADYTAVTGAITVTLNGSTTVNLRVDTVLEDTLVNVENIRAGSGADTLTGDTRANRLEGGAGNDTLSGKTGADTLLGGDGADNFVFDTALGAGNVDRVLDFEVGVDKLVVDDDVFTMLLSGFGGSLPADRFRVGSSAQDANDYLIWDPRTSYLFYDADANGVSAAVRVAVVTVTDTAPLGAGDFVIVA